MNLSIMTKAILLKYGYLCLGCLFFINNSYSQNMNGNNGRNFGRQQNNTIPQAEEATKAPEPMTAVKLVDKEMPSFIEALELNTFEAAVLSSILKKHLQDRIEAQILNYPPEKMREVVTKIMNNQDTELKNSLPPEKYVSFKTLQKDGVSKTIKRKRKKKKKSKHKE